MIQVTKEQAKEIRDRFPSAHITRTVHKYYVEEDHKVISYLKGLNNRKVRKHA